LCYRYECVNFGSKPLIPFRVETFILSLLLVFYVVIRYYTIDHDTPADKDRKRFAEGIALYEKSEYTAAHAFFDQQVKQHRKSALAYAYRGKCNLKDENLYSALYDFTKSLTFDNTIAHVHLDKGMAHYRLNEFNESFLSFDKAVWFSRGEEPESLRWRALARLKLHQLSQAEDDLNKAVQLGDEDAAYVLSQPPFMRKVRV
jgi:tetratricopeptide (TPR) repeat protein